MLILDLSVFGITTIICVVAYFKFKFSYWRKKGVPYIEPRIPFGTSENPFNRKHYSAVVVQNQYQHFKSFGYKYGGVYTFSKPALLLVDVDIVRNIMSKDFHFFTDRGFFHNEKHDPLSGNIFNLEGQKWRNLRAKLTPTFTSGKIKTMFPTLVACGDPLYAAVKEFNQEDIAIDVKDLSARYTTEVIGSCAFGIECNSFSEPESDFRKYGKMVFSASSIQALKILIATVNPDLGRRLGISILDSRPKEFFLNVVKETIAYRDSNKVVRNDFMQLLMDLRNTDSNGEKLTIEQIAAQAFIFFLAGFETSSTTMTFCLYELAINQKVQDKVREEIDTVVDKHNGNITYDTIMEMKYLNQVIEETLRKYPPLATIPRVCVQEYQIPGTDVIVENGTRILIPAYALHHDPEYFPDPEKFNPERFNVDNRASITPFSYIPFGEGPRICIGLRFGFLQTKVGLVRLLRDFKFKLNAKTKSPLTFDPDGFIISADGGVWLDTQRLSDDAA